MTSFNKEVTKSRSFLASPDAADIDKNLLTVILVLITITEGADNALFASVSRGLEELYTFFSFTILTTFSTMQGITGAFAGPVWGILASRGSVSRKTILIGGTMLQGLATILMVFVPTLFDDDKPGEERSQGVTIMLVLMGILRAINAIALAALRPVATSIVADTFSEEERGKRFGFLMAGLNIGGGVFGIIAASISRQQYNIDLGFVGGIVHGWQVAFIIVGVFTVALAPLCSMCLKVPTIQVDEEKIKAGAAGELRTLAKLMLQTRTFAILVIQGCFGLIPWRAFEFRLPFIQASGVPDAWAGSIQLAGQFTGAMGAFIGGAVGDGLSAHFHQLHGRILTAELSVYGGIPIAFMTFQTTPWGEAGSWEQWFFFLFWVVMLSFVATWAGPGCNSPVLCNICKESDRALVIAWQISLESAVGSLGPIMFGQLLSLFGYDRRCNDDDFKAEQQECLNASSGSNGNNSLEDCIDCRNASLMGRALFWTSCVPWGVCGLFYTTLHYFYPRDFAKMAAVLDMEDNELGAPLGSES